VRAAESTIDVKKLKEDIEGKEAELKATETAETTKTAGSESEGTQVAKEKGTDAYGKS
jgi:hypothetical protein